MAAPSNEAVIRVKGLRTGFDDALIHDNLDLDVYRGEILGVVGGSGTGKSVLLRAMVGLLRPRAGTIEVLGTDMSLASDAELANIGRRLGVLFQQGALFSSLTVRQNVQVPMREHLCLSQRLMDELADLKISMVGLPPEAGDKMPS
jgi:phospholipid/cholesterol/gamma-HCH transport system ATP-binding protein